MTATPTQVQGPQGVLADGQRAKLLTALTFAEYEALPGVNISTLLLLQGKTDAAAHWEITHPRPDTEALALGSAVHAAILEPTVFETMYCTQPAFGDLRSPANKKAKIEWEEAHADTVNLNTEQYATVLAVRANLATCNDPEIREMMDGPGQNEIGILFRDEPTNLLCKGRIDRITMLHGWPTIVEVKTTRCLLDRFIETELGEKHYHIRLAWYMDALSMIRPAEWLTVYLWLGTSEPNEVRTTQCDDHAYAEGRAVYRHLLDRYAKCQASGDWPSFRHGIEVINPPRWAYRYTKPQE